MSPILTTFYFDEQLGADYNAPLTLVEDLFQHPDGTLLNAAGYAMSTPPFGGAMPANDSYPFGVGTVLVPYDGLYSGTNQFNPWPTRGWFQSVGQYRVESGMCVAGGGPNPTTANNDVSAWCCAGALDLYAEIEFQWSAVDATYAAMSGTGNTIGVVWLNLRSMPSNQRGIALGNNRISAVADGTSASVWAFNAAAAGGLQHVVPAALVDGTTHVLGLSLQGQAFKMYMDGVIIDAGNLPVGPNVQQGTDQRPFDFSIFVGFELYRPDVTGLGGPGPAPLTKVLRFSAWTSSPTSPLVSARISSQGDFRSNGAGAWQIAG